MRSSSTFTLFGLLAALPLTAGASAACLPQSAAPSQAAAGQASVRDLTISEVSPGPMLSYIEIHNGSTVSISLDGFSLESASGSFQLGGLPDALDPAEYFVLLQGHPVEVGVSPDPLVPCIIVAEPTCGVLADTILLRDPKGSVVDALAYGVVADTSNRYQAAVDAGQFSAGSFVDVGAEFEQLVLGRNAQNLDTNHLSDWSTGGGADALVGSPFGPNSTVPEGEDLWVEAFQGYFSKTISQEYYGFRVVTGSFSNFIGDAAASTVAHSITVNGPIFGSADVVLTGTVDNRLTYLAQGRYATECEGKLFDSTATYGVEFRFRREVGGARDVTVISAKVQSGTTVYPFDLEVLREFTGQRGTYDESITRTLLMWSGTPKISAGSQAVQWSLGGDGSIARVDCSGSFSRPFPLSDGAIGQPATPPITMESMELDFHYDRAEGPSRLTWDKMEFDYGQGIPSIIGKDMTVTWSGAYGSPLVSQMTGSFLVGTLSIPYVSTSTKALSQDAKLTHWTVSNSVANVDLYASDVTYDPLLGEGDGWWDRARRAVRWTGKAMGTVAMTGIGLVGCGMTTAGGAALGGGVTLGTLGTATPAGLAAAGGGVLACAGIGSGCAWVIDEIWAK